MNALIAATRILTTTTTQLLNSIQSNIHSYTMAGSSALPVPTDDDDDDDILDESSRGESILSKVFASCAGDPKGSVHRAWGVSLIFLVIYFILSIFESTYYYCIIVYSICDFYHDASTHVTTFVFEQSPIIL
jgi:hypothetical protein